MEKSFSSLYLDLMKEFGKAGGFQMIIEKVMTQKKVLSVELLFAYIELMASPHNLYHRAYIIEAVAPFVENVFNYMAEIPDEQLRNVKREKLDYAIAQMELLFRRTYTAKTKSEQGIRLKVAIALSLLRSELLERRIQAIRLLAETCKSAKASQVATYQSIYPSQNDSAILSSLLQVSQVIEEIFGKRSHIQLIQRSVDILKFFLQNSKISRDDFNVIWDCCSHDEQSKIEIFKVISDASNLLPSELVGFISEKYTNIPNTSFKDQDIELLCELGSRYARPTFNVLKAILAIEWQLIKGEISGISSEIYMKAMERFCDVITTPTLVPEATMQEFFKEAYKMLEKGENSLIAIKVLRKSLIQLPIIHRFFNKADMLSTFLTEGNVISNFFIVNL